MPEDIQQRVLRAFQQEHREHIAAIRAILAKWPAFSTEELNEAFRLAHSLKGGARVCDLPSIEALTHHAEQVFAAIQRNPAAATDSSRNDIEAILAAVEDYMAALAEGTHPNEPAELFQQLGLDLPKVSPVADQQTAPSAPAQTPIPREETLRVSAVHLERLHTSVGELLSESFQQNQSHLDLHQLNQKLVGLWQRVDSEGLGEDELRSSLAQITRLSRQAVSRQRSNARRLRLLTEQLAAHVLDARMVPVQSVFEGFPKMVRDLAATEGKQVSLITHGLELDADRLVLQALKDPVMHALRNALSHGIESPSERERAGKPASGRIELRATVAGNRLNLRITDDGRGIDLQDVLEKAVSRELVPEDEAKSLTASETMSLLFRAGFSTREDITPLAGRGMGLSVVREAAARLQGTVQLGTASPFGTELTIEVPLTAATHHLLMVQSGEASYAIPMSMIQSLHRVALSAVQVSNGKAHLWLENQSVLLASLGDIFRQQEQPVSPVGGLINIVLLRAGGNVLALAVDRLLRELNSLVAPLPRPADRSPYFSGGVVLENGKTALVLDPSAIVERFRGAAWKEPAKRAAVRKPRHTILVVDDSFTARTLQKNILEAAGFDVRIATNGVEALGLLKVGDFDAIVADVQMPQMDGFQLLQNIKADEQLQEIPLVLVTSLNSEEDQARGLALGAHAYIVKQKFDHQELLEVIRQLF